MTATESGRTRRPQLTDTITHLNDVIDGLATAVPEVVADTLKQTLGADFADRLGRAVAQALLAPVRDLVKTEVAAAVADRGSAPVNAEPLVPPRAKPTLAARIRGGWTRLRSWTTRQCSTATAWAGRQWDAVTGVAAVAWAVLRLLATAVVHSPTAVVGAVLGSAAFGLLAAVADPLVGVVLSALSGGGLTGALTAAAPLVRSLTFDLDREAV